MTTKLAMALITEVAKPREGALNSFEAGDCDSIDKVVFYSVLKALDVMSNIAEADFRDHPVVSTELVKFLSLNTSVEAVDKLQTQSREARETIKELVKESAGSKKTLQTVANKTDEVKKVMEALKKRVEKLEKK